MNLRHALAISAALIALGAACKPRPVVPAWMQSAPPSASLGVSGDLGWLLRQAAFQQLLQRYPMADRTLDLFLKQARINPAQETGRLGFFLVGDVKTMVGAASKDPTEAAGAFLISLSDFRDPKALMAALAETFPVEGSLVVGKKEYNLHVVMDFNQVHVRAVMDDQGHVWLGDLKALAGLGGHEPMARPVIQAAGWMTPGTSLQGFVDFQRIPLPEFPRQREALSFDIPRGIEAAAYSAAPAAGGAFRFELILAGRPEGIRAVQPWLQRIVAGAAGLQGTGAGPASELLQENERVVLRCTLKEDHMKALIGLLNPQAGTLGPMPPGGKGRA